MYVHSVPRRRSHRISTAAGLALALLTATTAATVAASPAYPSKPINLIVSYPAGGSVDVAARIIQEPVGASLGQPIVIENRGGAGGTIGTAFVAKSAPDGHTLLLTLSSHTINPAIYKKLPFDTAKDFKPVTLVASAPQVLVAHPSVPVGTIRELIAYANTRPNGLDYGSAGTGSPSHIAGEQLRLKTKAKLTHIAYRGGGPAVIDVLGNQIPVLWVSLPAVAEFIKQGKLKGIAVSTAKRSPLFPDMPTVAESVPGFEVDSWYAMFAPANTPQAVVDKVQAAVSKALKDPDIQKKFLAQGAVAVGSTASELDQRVTREIGEWRKLAQEAKISVD